MLVLQRTLLITERPGRGKKTNSDKVETHQHTTFLGNLPLERDDERKGVTYVKVVFLLEHAMNQEVLMTALLA